MREWAERCESSAKVHDDDAYNASNVWTLTQVDHGSELMSQTVQSTCHASALVLAMKALVHCTGVGKIVEYVVLQYWSILVFRSEVRWIDLLQVVQYEFCTGVHCTSGSTPYLNLESIA